MRNLARAHWAVAALAIVVAAPCVAAPSRAVIVDIENASTEQVEAWRDAPGVESWVELGRELLLTGDTTRIAQSTGLGLAMRDIGAYAVDDLVLHLRGCAVDVTPADLLVHTGGRYDLLVRPDAARRATLTHAEAEGLDEWIDVTPGMVVARQYRFERPVALPADERITPLVARVDTTRWFADVETLAGWSRSTFSTELVAARQWIAARFTSLGLEVSEPAFTFTYQGTRTANNVMGVVRGLQRPDDWVIVGGHYDSRQQDIMNPANAPGADDNASGCSAVLELARLFTRARPAATMIFMCYAGEEQNLFGSKAHVQALTASGDLGKIKLVATLDMIGWSSSASLSADLDTLSPFVATRNRFADAALTYVPGLTPVVSTIACCSDHIPYAQAGVPAVLSIHGNWQSYVHYHRTTDTPANLGAHAQAIGGAIMRMNVATVAGEAGPMDRIFDAGLEAGE
ncbi:M28 family metallopeptidase [Dokdonella sp. MW10]|uniref:M28 family metallopeptidase n=1 Tax=Dokdonella sp. MW10 TaxID=2992926 RepID=UPI003F809FEE